MVAEGKIPASRLTVDTPYIPTLDDEDIRPFVITKKMLRKCLDLMTFNVDTSNDVQLKLSLKEYAKVSKVLSHIEFIRDLPINKDFEVATKVGEAVGVDVNDGRLQSKVWKVKIDRINKIYGGADFNYQIFVATLEDHFADQRRKKEREDKKEEKKKGSKEMAKDGDNSRSLTATLCSNLSLISFAAILMLVLLLFRSNLHMPLMAMISPVFKPSSNT